MKSRLFVLCTSALGLSWPDTARRLRGRRAEPSSADNILYDAFGKPSVMDKDWVAASREYGGKRILFDTGDTPTSWPTTQKPRT